MNWIVCAPVPDFWRMWLPRRDAWILPSFRPNCVANGRLPLESNAIRIQVEGGRLDCVRIDRTARSRAGTRLTLLPDDRYLWQGNWADPYLVSHPAVECCDQRNCPCPLTRNWPPMCSDRCRWTTLSMTTIAMLDVVELWPFRRVTWVPRMRPWLLVSSAIKNEKRNFNFLSSSRYDNCLLFKF